MFYQRYDYAYFHDIHYIYIYINYGLLLFEHNLTNI